MSLFKQFIKLRDTLSQRMSDNIDFLNLVATKQGTLTADAVPVLNDKTISAETIQGSVILRLRNDLGEEISQLSYQNVDDLNSICLQEYKWSDLLDQVSDGANAYQIFGELAAKFSYTNRIQYSDIVNYIDSFSPDRAYQVKDALFNAVNEDGYITKNSFTAAMQSIIAKADDAATNNTYALDETNPYTVAAVLNIAVQAAGLAIGAVCTILGGVYGVVLTIIGGIISLLVSMVGSLEEYGSMRVNLEVANQYVAGPLIALDNATDSNVNYQAGFAGKHVWLSESNGMGVFLWPSDFSQNMPTEFKINGYLYPCWDAYYIVKYLYGHNNLGVDTSMSQIKVYNGSFIADMFKDQYMQIYKYNESEYPVDALEIGASLLIDHFVQTMACFETSDHASDYTFSYSYQTHGSGKDETLMMYCCSLINQLITYRNDDKYLALSQCRSTIEYGLNALANWIKDEVIPYRNLVNGRPNNDAKPYVISSSAGYMPMIYCPITGNRAISTWYNGQVLIKLNGDTYAYDHLDFPDCLPTDWGIVLPQVDLQKLNNVLVSIALATTAIAIAGTQIKKCIAKKMIAKQTLRANELNSKRDAFLADPTNDILRKRYVDSVYRYNKYAKWFGWGTYDVANGWVDSSSATSYNDASQWSAAFKSNNALLQTIKSLIKVE